MNDLESYRANGFVVVRKFFTVREVEAVRRDAMRIFHHQFLHKGYTDLALEELPEGEFNRALYRLFREDLGCLSNCGKQAQHLISLHRLSLDARVEDLLRSMGLTTPNIATRPVLYFNHPLLAQRKIFHTVDAHQDWRSMQGSLNSLVLWVPLVDVDDRLGALQVIPGSHLWGLRTSAIDAGFGMVDLSTEEVRSLVSVELTRGDVLAFSTFLVHQSGNNTTDAPRWSCHFRYNDLGEDAFIRRRYAHPYLYKPSEELLTPGFPAEPDVRNAFRPAEIRAGSSRSAITGRSTRRVPPVGRRTNGRRLSRGARGVG